MKKYYLHNGTESSGPFDIEELKIKKITKASPIWFEGMLQWKTAGELPELNHLFISKPPEFSISESSSNIVKTKEKRKILGLPQKTFLGICFALVTLVVITVLNNLEENKSRELQLKNEKTEIENRKLEQEQKQLDEQKIQAVIQEKIDAERKARELKQNATTRLIEIEKLLLDYQVQLDETKKKIMDSSGFKPLRTTTEKEKQLNLLHKNTDSITAQMTLLKKESNQLQLELDKIPN